MKDKNKENGIKLRHPKGDPPADFQICFIWPQCERAEYQRGRFISSGQTCSVVHLGVELWCEWHKITELFEYPEDHEFGRIK